MINLIRMDWISFLLIFISIFLIYIASLLKRIYTKLSEMHAVTVTEFSRSVQTTNLPDSAIESIEEQELAAVTAALLQVLPNQQIKEVRITR